MSEAVGKISRGETHFATVALLTFEPTGSPCDPIGYKGSFILSEGTPWPTVGELFTLATAEGRFGHIVVERLSSGPHQDTLVFFAPVVPSPEDSADAFPSPSSAYLVIRSRGSLAQRASPGRAPGLPSAATSTTQRDALRPAGSEAAQMPSKGRISGSELGKPLRCLSFYGASDSVENPAARYG